MICTLTSTCLFQVCLFAVCACAGIWKNHPVETLEGKKKSMLSGNTLIKAVCVECVV